ncbi:hypothetical protein [Clostridium aceticum]|nr:hypothetical protein [Clostridium aceticum]
MKLIFNLRTVVKIVLILVCILILHSITANGESVYLWDSGGETVYLSRR